MRFMPWPYPSGSIKPDSAQIQRLLNLGYVGQTKIDGRSCEILIASTGELAVYTRHGTPYTRPLPQHLTERLLAEYRPTQGFTVLAGEYLSQMQTIYLYDCLALEGDDLTRRPYLERYADIPIGSFEVLPIFRTVEECMAIIETISPFVEGLVFKAPGSGIKNSIIRCRKPSHRHALGGLK
jgi:hypothetical protein